MPGYWLEGRVEYVRTHLSVRKLASDMVSFVGEEMPTAFTRPSPKGWRDRDHIEASHVVKRGGIYYLMWSEGSFSSPDPERSYRVNCATTRSPLGPWHSAENNPILESSPEVGLVGPGHHGVVRIPGTDEWWCVYHGHPGDADRRVWIDRMAFGADGRVVPIVPTREGPPSRSIALGLGLTSTGPFEGGAPVGFRTVAHGAFSRIELFSGDRKLGECGGDSSPWRWDAPPVGFHRIHARGEMPDGRTVRSADVDLDVTAAS